MQIFAYYTIPVISDLSFLTPPLELEAASVVLASNTSTTSDLKSQLGSHHNLFVLYRRVEKEFPYTIILRKELRYTEDTKERLESISNKEEYSGK